MSQLADLKKLRPYFEPPGDLAAATFLYMVDEGLIVAPEAISLLTDLKELNFYDNKLTTLPDSYSALTNLSVLGIGRNQRFLGIVAAKDILKERKKRIYTTICVYLISLNEYLLPNHLILVVIESGITKDKENAELIHSFIPSRLINIYSFRRSPRLRVNFVAFHPCILKEIRYPRFPHGLHAFHDLNDS
eukprot:TRINITY_DN9426_c0_g1_i1.p1 TRINITY_DN9426_c0_g1~~TRINITY_DN9426_c0_g1_i1.p1  ORF type:complete len:190 (-),score=28.14 TRINITY_DN9426_c0_g1_i1:289-858(-)